MSDPQADPGPPDPAPPSPQLREVEYWEYMTAYRWNFQVRVHQDLHARLVDWAKSEGRRLDDLVEDVLHDAIAKRSG
jgi:hypothetical protein